MLEPVPLISHHDAELKHFADIKYAESEVTSARFILERHRPLLVEQEMELRRYEEEVWKAYRALEKYVYCECDFNR